MLFSLHNIEILCVCVCVCVWGWGGEVFKRGCLTSLHNVAVLCVSVYPCVLDTLTAKCTCKVSLHYVVCTTIY